MNLDCLIDPNDRARRVGGFLKCRVSALSHQPKFEIVALTLLDVVQLDQIASLLSKIIDRRWLDDTMKELAGSYLRWILCGR